MLYLWSLLPTFGEPRTIERSLTVKYYSAELSEALNSLKWPGFFYLLEGARLALGKGGSQPETFIIRSLTSF